MLTPRTYIFSSCVRCPTWFAEEWIQQQSDAVPLKDTCLSMFVMLFGTQIHTAIIITTWEKYVIYFFPNYVNVLKIIVCGWNCEFTTIWRFKPIFCHLSKYACGIHFKERFYVQWNEVQNEMHPREWHTNTIGQELFIHRQFYFPDFLPVTVTGWQDFAASLTEKCQSAMFITVLSTNYMPHKKGPYTSHNTWKVCITEWLRFYSI